MQTTRPTSKQEQELMATIWDPRIADDPLAFVLLAFPWGQKNTPLEKFPEGPREWQRDELKKIAAHIKENKRRIADLPRLRSLLPPGLSKVAQELALAPHMPQVYKSATTSGRGTGKSALVSWLQLWMLSTQLGATCVVAANSEVQLKTKTWAELGKWHALAINAHWFEKAAMSLKPQTWFSKLLKEQLRIDDTYFYSQAQLWTEENPDAFAGTHNQAGIMVIFDEASGIPKAIWGVTDGFFTEPILHRYQFCFSNPRRNTGMFYECFHKFRKYWNRRKLNSLEVEGTDKAELQAIVDKNGKDSDEARVEVFGEFPRQSENQFISREVVAQAQERDTIRDDYAALVMGVDPARYGDDKTCIRWRQGRNGRVIKPSYLKGKDNMVVANEVARLIDLHKPDGVFIDVGNGTGVIDRLREMGYHVYEVSFGSAADDEQWMNKKTEMWDAMRTWLGGGCIDDSEDLEDDLVGPQYKIVEKTDQVRLETKEEMKKRGLDSPDDADALACTFFKRIPRKDNPLHRSTRRTARIAKGTGGLSI